MIVSIFNKESGLFDRIVDAPDDQISIQLKVDEGYVEGAYDSELYYVVVDTDEVKMRGDFTLNSIPTPSEVTIEGVKYLCTDQPVFKFDAPGTYKIQVNAGPAYLVKEFEIDYQP